MIRSWLITSWLLVALPLVVLGQDDIVVEEGPLIDQQPFDMIHLTAKEGGDSFKVMPLLLPNRKVPPNPSPNDRIEAVFIKFPDRRYDIAWRSIERIELYEDMILAEAKKKLSEKDYIGAFQNLSFLMRNYPDTPRLDELRVEFLYSSLSVSYSAKQLEQTLSTLEELKQTAPQYREEAVTRALNNIANALLEGYQKRDDFDSVKQMVARLKNSYGAVDVVKQWEGRLKDLAGAKLSQAEQLIQIKNYRDAFKAVYASLALSPDSERSQQLLSELNRQHPMVRVGVMQRSSELDPTSLTNWSSRRAGLLVNQPVFQFLKTGNEGGDYVFAFGKHRLSDDRRSIMLNLDRNLAKGPVSLKLAEWIVDRANPQHKEYDPVWAAIFQSVQFKGANQLEVQLQRPFVLPHSLMQWIVADHSVEWSDVAGLLRGPYERTSNEESEAVYTLRSDLRGSGLPVEIIEVFYDDSEMATNDLARGYIDAIDQLYPADAKRLSAERRFRAAAYLLPTTHMLVPAPNSDHEFLRHEKFRRALLYATDRESVLKDELLGSLDPLDGRLVSGPFPLGNSDTDPLAYAYNSDVKPVGYDAQLGKILVTIAKQELEKKASKLGTKPPVLERLVVGCPDFEFARIAVQALIQQWAVIGVEAEMLLLPSGNDPKLIEQCDLLYVTTTLWEPATDIQRLLGGNSILRSDDPYVVQGLRRLAEAKSWREVRTALHELHQIIAYHLPVLPLWQVTDRFAVRSSIRGIAERPVSLYQDLKDWRLNE